MHNELLAVVDEHDRIIDHCSRDQIHALALRHRAVHILVFNDAGQLLLYPSLIKFWFRYNE